MHAPSTPATAVFPMLRPSRLLLQHRENPPAGGGLGGGSGERGWARTRRATENPGLAKGCLVPLPAPSSSAELANRVSFNPHRRGLGDRPTAQACLCKNASLGSSAKPFPP